MQLQGSQTEKNLRAAFAEEPATGIGTLPVARTSGRLDVADVFEQLAANEAGHARREFEFPGGADELRGNLERAMQGERLEHEEIYPRFAQGAREEGFLEIAEFFERMPEVERAYERIRRQFGGSMALNAWAAVGGRVEVGDPVELIDDVDAGPPPVWGRFARPDH